MKKLVKCIFAIFCFVITINAYALKFVPSNKAIVNFDDAIANLKQQTSIPVLFPNKIPISSQVNAQTKFFLSTMVFPNGNGYSISVDTTANCKGAKYCSIGTITAQKGERPQIYSDMNGTDLTVPIVLYQGLKGYYTPDHTEADFWPTQIEFKKGFVLYRVSWMVMDMLQEKYVISLLTNSMLQTGPY